MEVIKNLNKRKIPIVVIDQTLEKFVDEPLFADKVAKANETLKKVGLPKIKTDLKKK